MMICKILFTVSLSLNVFYFVAFSWTFIDVQRPKVSRVLNFVVRPLLVLSLFPEPDRRNFGSVGLSLKKIIYRKSSKNEQFKREVMIGIFYCMNEIMFYMCIYLGQSM